MTMHCNATRPTIETAVGVVGLKSWDQMWFGVTFAEYKASANKPSLASQIIAKACAPFLSRKRRGT